MSKARDLANAGTALTTVSATELGYVDGVTSAIQTQINSKIGQSTAINPTIVDAKGDIIAATASDTVARLAVGANGTVLTAASGEATGLQWAAPAAGGMTLLATVTLSGTTTTVSSINQTYNNLVFVSDGVSWSSGGEIFEVRPNGVSSSGRYSYVDGSSAGSKTAIYPMSEVGSTPNNNDCFYLIINNYTSTKHKPTTFYGGNINAVTSCIGGGRIATTSPITSMTFTTQSVTPTLSGTVLVYGVK